MNAWKRTLLGLLLGLAALLPAHGAPPADILIGSSAALSGPAQLLGQRFHAGARAYFNQVNKQGGINGARLVLDLRDDGYESDRAEANTRQLVDDPRTLALFGYVGTPTSQVALPYVRRADMAFVAAYSGADLLRSPPIEQVFNVRASYRDEAKRLVQDMQAVGVRSVGVFYQYDSFGRAGLEALRAAAQPAGITINEGASVMRNSIRVEDAVRTLVRGSQNDAIFMVSSYQACAAFARTARAQGYAGRFYTLSFAGLEPLRQALRQDGPPVTVTQVVPNPANAAIAVVDAYQKAMQAVGDSRYDSLSLEGYIGARVLVDGLRRAAQPLTRHSVQDAFEHLGALDLGGFAVQYEPGHNQGSTLVEIRSTK